MSGKRRTISFVLGGPCSGKGFFCERIEALSNHKIAALSAGALLRQEISRKGKLSSQLTEYLNAGQIVPAKITINLFEQAITQASDPDHFILDGFPRNFDNFSTFFEMHPIGKSDAQDSFPAFNKIFYLNTSPQTMERLFARRQSQEKRSDDNAETFKKRLGIFGTDTLGVVKMASEKGFVREIDLESLMGPASLECADPEKPFQLNYMKYDSLLLQTIDQILGRFQ